MIKEDDIIKADPSKILVYIPEELVWGKTARLATYKGHQLQEEDFAEIEEDDVVEIDGTSYVFCGWEYNDVVEFIIKLHYSYDSQFAIILNYQQDPETGKEDYDEMQNWRDFAKEVARKYIKTK